MPIQTLNETPRFTLHMKELLKARGQRIGIVDVGARGGVPKFAEAFYGIVDLVCFDPDEEECRKLNAALGQHGIRFLPFALHDKAGRFPFYLARSPWCHGFTKANEDFSGRFPNAMLNENVGVIELDAVTLDMAMATEDVKNVDFIKLDTEGTELRVLQGGLDTLSQKGVIGVFTEFWWDQRYHNQPSFAELDIFMREQGFMMFDVVVQRYPRNSLPVGPLELKRDGERSYLEAPLLFKDYGQVMTGDALYIRDPIADRRAGAPFRWSREKLLSLLCFLDVFNYGDMAIEVIDAYRDEVDFGEKPERMMDLLVPPVANLKYPEYFTYSEAMFRGSLLRPEVHDRSLYEDYIIRPARYDTTE